MQESLKLFNWVANHQIFLKTPIILFLNKVDLFHEKIKSFSLKETFPDYQGSQDPKECIKFIQKRYLDQNYDPKERFIYTHETCATDTKQVSFVINSTMNTIIEQNLSTSGLV